MMYLLMIDGEPYTVVQTDEQSLLISILDGMVDAGAIDEYRIVSIYVDTIDEAVQRLADDYR